MLYRATMSPMSQLVQLVVIVAVVACNSPAKQVEGTSSVIDAMTPRLDSAPDAKIMFDARSPDAPIECPLTVPDPAPTVMSIPSPTCQSAPTLLIQVAPFFLSSFVTTGDTMYVASYEKFGAAITYGRIEEVSLTTGVRTQVLETLGYTNLTSIHGHVFAADNDDDRGWLLEPGNPPRQLNFDAFAARQILADDTHLYWTTNLGDQLYRQPLCGGQTEDVMKCGNAYAIEIGDEHVYCSTVSELLQRRKDLTQNSVVIASGEITTGLKEEGSILYGVDIFGKMWKFDLMTQQRTAIATTSTVQRPEKLFTTDAFIYLAFQSEVKRVSKFGGGATVIVARNFVSMPALTSVWKNKILIGTEDAVLQCGN
jgi:hypothetical protein